MKLSRRLAVALVLVAAFAVVHTPLARRVRAAGLLLALSSAHAKSGSSSAERAPLVEKELVLPGRDGPIRARLYQVEGALPRPGLVIAHGVHWRGIDEKRLIPFARELARAGRVVLTPEIRDLTDYRITLQGAGVIGDSALWLSARPDLVSSPEVGVLGFSFAGGLALVAASRPELDGRLSYVTSVGGHHNLRRVLGFLMTDEIQTRNGLVREKAHDYGLIVLVYQNLDTFVDPPDRELLRDSLRQWLREERDQSLLRASLRTTASGERLYRLLDTQNLKELRPELERLLDANSEALAELSPRGRLGRVRAPVYLLHGSGDSVIPPSETEWAAAELGDAPHQALVSPLLEHVEVSKSAAIGHQLALVDFMSKML